MVHQTAKFFQGLNEFFLGNAQKFWSPNFLSLKPLFENNQKLVTKFFNMVQLGQ
jgi:hypothetical protein